VTIDAAGCQKNIAVQIVRGKGHYVLALKGNQGKLFDVMKRRMAGWSVGFMMQILTGKGTQCALVLESKN